MYLEAITLKLALNLIFDMQANGLKCTYIKFDFWDLYSGKREKKIFTNLEEAKIYFDSNYIGYNFSDRAGSIVGLEIFQTSGFFDFDFDINGDDIVGKIYDLKEGKTYDSFRNLLFQRIVDFHKSNVKSLIDSYRELYFQFIDPFSTIYAFIYAKPGYFRHTNDLERVKLDIMNKKI